MSVTLPMVFETTKTGYLKDWATWTPAFAEQLALTLDLPLTDLHWKVLVVMRDIYAKHHRVAGMRPLINQLKKTGFELADSSAIQQLFPVGIAQIIRLSGLPQSKRCL